jgi:Fur family transcriptional regulator, ferric uptake regulator
MRALHPKRPSLLDALVAKGFRATSQRKVLLETIQTAEGRLNAANLLHLARQRDPHVDRATVYRTLDLLKRLRLVDELDLMHPSGEKHHYEMRGARDHVHLACFSCGAIKEFVSPFIDRLKRQIARQNGFDIRVIRLEIGGRCRDCRAAASKRGGDPEQSAK